MHSCRQISRDGYFLLTILKIDRFSGAVLLSQPLNGSKTAMQRRIPRDGLQHEQSALQKEATIKIIGVVVIL